MKKFLQQVLYLFWPDLKPEQPDAEFEEFSRQMHATKALVESIEAEQALCAGRPVILLPPSHTIH